MAGYIKLQRDLKDHWIWESDERFTKRDAFVDIIFRCNHRCVRVPIGGKLTLVKRGQFISSNLKLGEAWKWDEKTVRRFMLLLQQECMVSFFPTNKYTLYEVTNYAEHQSVDTVAVQPVKRRAKAEQMPSKSRTNAEQAPTNNNDLIMINNDKEIKDIYSDVVFLTKDEYQKLLKQFGEKDTLEKISNLSLYVQSKGVKYKSHYATILSWERKNAGKTVQFKPQQTPQYANFEQRSYTEEEYEKLYANLNK